MRLCFTISETKNWNRRLEPKAEELYEDGLCTSQTTVFSRWMYENGFKVYTETGNVLETIRRFQRQFLNRNVHYCRRSCSKLNHTGHTYCNCPLLFVYTVSSDSETAFEKSIIVCLHGVLWFGNCLWNLLIVSRTFPVSVYPFIYWEMWSGPGGGGTQLWVGYGCTARSFDHHPITKPEKTQICNLCLNHLFLEGPCLKPVSTFYHLN